MSQLVNIFDNAATMEIPDDFKCIPPLKTPIRKRSDIRQIKKKPQMWRRLFHVTYNDSPRTYFYNPSKPDTRIVCSDSTSTPWSSDLAQTAKILENAVYTTYKNPSAVKAVIHHDKNGEPLAAITYSLAVETGIWYVLAISLPIRGHMDGITMKCTAEDAEIRWNQFLAVADSITILEP
ncbi:hypothetical protein OZX67_08480 [Bifidobacterium sp. ESL0728]|uniref:hypothetical protein n=1 Tax=Bifidobacterium sp. ESL0728 TaxID=2983220 RepID=UPI0023F62A85|nr:hypothetical protein [Bifidobacterium sp. ESL0728]WEV58813.1 hypothetical protein OZX67_08480 [Bifidobacterium sp. ESL0728]